MKGIGRWVCYVDVLMGVWVWIWQWWDVGEKEEEKKEDGCFIWVYG